MLKFKFGRAALGALGVTAAVSAVAPLAHVQATTDAGAPITPLDDVFKEDFDDAARFSWPHPKLQRGAGKPKAIVLAKGQLQWLDGSTPATIKLPKQPDEWIERLQLKQSGTSLMAVYDLNAGGDGRGMACRIELQPKLRLAWCTSGFGFNAIGNLAQQHLYVSAIGFAGKLDLTQGRFVWKLDKLYQRDKDFNVVCLITVNPQAQPPEANFLGAATPQGGSKLLSVDDRNGKVIAITATKIKSPC